MILAALLALGGQTAAVPTPLRPLGAPECRFDRAAMLALDENAFDQDFTGGWRAVSNRGCELTAADLIRDYRKAHTLTRTMTISFWHEGQLRADAGQSGRAIKLFEQARHPPDEPFGWNLYVDGSIAFLRGDRSALQAARDKLAVLPMPEGYGTNIKRPDGSPAPVKWPLNLNVLDGFLRCFDRDYRAAYGCAKPIFTFEAK